MKKYTFVFLSMLSTSNFFGQNKKEFGSIEIYIEDTQVHPYTYVEFHLFQKDSLFKIAKGSDMGNYTFDSLPASTYSLMCYFNDVLKVSYHNLEVKNERIITVTPGYEIEDHNTRIDSTNSHQIDITINFLYSNPTLTGEKNSFISGNYYINYRLNIFPIVTKHFLTGFSIGPSLDYSSFYPSKTVSPPGPHFRESYNSGNISFGSISRLSFFNNKISNRDGLKLDLGIYYNIPVFFQHVVADKNYKTKTSWIHQFTDFSATFRVSYKHVGIQTDIRLFDYLMGNFPELPRFRLGICLLISPD